MYSFNRSFWIVPRSEVQGIPSLRARERTIASRMAAVLLIVIEIETRSNGILLRRVSMSRNELIETPTFPTSPADQFVVRIQTHLGREVESHAQTRLTVLQQVVIAPVGLLGRPEARILPHGPEPSAIHVAIDSPGERVFTRGFRSQAWDSLRRVVNGFLLHAGLTLRQQRRSAGW